jgi:hypothetical protein
MAAAVVAATVQVIDPSHGALTVDNNLRIASISIAAYEYVVLTVLLIFVMTYTLPVISLPFLLNIGYTKPQADVGRKLHVRMRRLHSNRNRAPE